VTARTDAQAAFEKRPACVLEVDLDYCQNTYGVAPCTAGRVESGTAQAGAASSITLRAGASAANGAYTGMVVRITGGTGAGQEAAITAYDGTTKVATVNAPWATNPNATSTYDVINRAAGCYNVFSGDSPCQSKANYVKGTKTIKFSSRGMTIPTGEQVRPYIDDVQFTPTQIDPSKGLSARSQTSVKMVDEPTPYDDLDKNVAYRAAAAGGTFMRRLVARNPNVVGRYARVRNGYVKRLLTGPPFKPNCTWWTRSKGRTPRATSRWC
jgi:hypothetical protein